MVTSFVGNWGWDSEIFSVNLFVWIISCSTWREDGIGRLKLVNLKGNKLIRNDHSEGKFLLWVLENRIFWPKFPALFQDSWSLCAVKPFKRPYDVKGSAEGFTIDKKCPEKDRIIFSHASLCLTRVLGQIFDLLSSESLSMS